MKESNTYGAVAIARAEEYGGFAPLMYLHDYYTVFLRLRAAYSDHPFGCRNDDYTDAAMIFRCPSQCHSLPYANPDTPPEWSLAFGHEVADAIGCKHGCDGSGYSFFNYYPDEALHLSERETRIVQRCMADIYAELERPADRYSTTLLADLISCLLEQVSRFYERQFITRSPMDQRLLSQYKALLDRHMNDGGMKGTGIPAPDSFAARLGVSPAYLSDLICHETGCSHAEFAEIRRMALAKRLLRDTQLNVNTIAAHLGFASPQSFRLMFCKLTGRTPERFRMRVPGSQRA